MIAYVLNLIDLSCTLWALHHGAVELNPLMREVTVMVGYKVIIDNAHAGMIYENQVHGRALHAGERLSGAVTAVREDGKLDVVPGQIGPARFRNFADMLLDELDDAGGFLPFGDHTPADVIARRFGVSKKTFKQALGSLYRNRRIVIADDGIRLPY